VTGFLRSDALLAAEPSRLLIRAEDTLLVVEFDVEVNPAALVLSIANSGVAAFGDVVDAHGFGAIVEQVSDAGLMAADLEGARPGGCIVPLTDFCGLEADAQAEFLASGATVLVTATEALVVRTDDTGLARAGLRLFVSRFEDYIRLSVFGAALANRGIAVGGDLPPASSMEWLSVHKWTSGVTAVNLTSNRVTGYLSSMRDVVSPDAGRLGIAEITGVDAFVTFDSSAWFVSMGRTAHPNLRSVDPFDSTAAFVASTTGVADSERLARVKCRAEGIERFVTGDFVASSVIRSCASDLCSPWLDPRAIVSYSARQRADLSLGQFDADSPEWWVEGESRQGPAYIPAALTYCPFPAIPKWLCGSAVSSSGVAAHPDPKEARLRAWLELVERDAFQRARLLGATSPPSRLALNSLSGRLRSLADLVGEYGRVTLLRLVSPTGLPVVLARVDAVDGVVLGMCAHACEADAAAKALMEALAQSARPFTHDVLLEEVRGPGDHAALYRTLEWRRRLDWMLIGPEEKLAMDSAARAACPDSVHAYQFRSEVSAGLTVVRVLDPELIPLTFGYDSDPLGRSDVQILARQANLSLERPLDPHPFA